MDKNILLIGGGGHCHSVLDSILAKNEFARIGIIDFDKNVSVLGVEVVGTDDDLPKLFAEGWKYAFLTVGSIGNTRLRHKLYEQICAIGFAIPSIIDPTAIIAKNVEIAKGVFIGKRVVLNEGTRIGELSIINTGAIVEHDCTIGKFAHISPGAILCGQVEVGQDCHIGAGSVVRQLIRIGNNSIIGAGSVVVGNIPCKVKAYGNPCKVVNECLHI